MYLSVGAEVDKMRIKIKIIRNFTGSYMNVYIVFSLSTRDVGITQVSFANNHAHDYREKGVNRTVDSLVKNGIGVSGVVYGKDGYQKQVRKRFSLNS